MLKWDTDIFSLKPLKLLSSFQKHQCREAEKAHGGERKENSKLIRWEETMTIILGTSHMVQALAMWN